MPTRFAVEPELNISTCLTENFFAKSASKRLTFSPMLNIPLLITRCIASISSFPQLDSANSYRIGTPKSESLTFFGVSFMRINVYDIRISGIEPAFQWFYEHIRTKFFARQVGVHVFDWCFPPEDARFISMMLMHIDVADNRTIVAKNFFDLRFHFRMIVDGNRLYPISLDNLYKVRRIIAYRPARFGAALKVGFLKCLRNTVDMIIKNKGFYLDTIIHKSLQFLLIHIESAIANRTDNGAIRCGKPSAHCSSKRKAHWRIPIIGNITLTILGFEGMIANHDRSEEHTSELQSQF